MRFVALLAVLLLPAASADWPSFHNDERNRGLGPGDYAVYDSVWWTEDLGVGHIEASSVLADGILVVAGSSGKVVALDASSGKMKWNTTMAAGVVGTPAIASGWLYVVDTAGNLKAFDLETGIEPPNVKPAAVGPTFGGLTIHEGSVYVGNEEGKMFRLLAERLGTPVWTFDTGSVFAEREFDPKLNATVCSEKIEAGAIRTTPAVYKGHVVFGSNNNYVYAVSELGRGQVQWIYQTEDLVLSSPAIDQDRDRVIVGSYDRSVVSLPLSVSGKVESCTSGVHAPSPRPVWTYLVPSDVGNSAVRATPAISGTDIVIGALNGRLYGVSATTGKQVWDHNTGSPVSGSPAIANGLVVAPNDAGRLVWLHLDNGTEVKRFEAEAALKASPALIQDRTYIATFDGRVSLLGAGFPKRPDLLVEAPVIEDGQVTVRVHNVGEGAADPTVVRLHLEGEFLADLNVTGLASGANARLTHPLDLGPPFRIQATVDPLNAVAETDEGNNVRQTTVVLPPPDAGTDDPATTEGTTTGPPPGIPGPAFGLLLAGLLLLAWTRRGGRP